MDILTTNKQLKRSLSDPATNRLIAYFYQLEHPVILREIRSIFSEDVQLDKRLDLLIQTGVVERKDRRYRLLLPVYQDFPQSALYNQLTQLIGTDELISFVEQFYPEELAGPLAVTFDLPCRTLLENNSYELVTLNAQGITSLTLPNYFYYQQEKRPESFGSLEKLLGDVHPGFFFNQVELLLASLLKGKQPKRNSIFLKSLVMTEVASAGPEWKLEVPVVQEKTELGEVASLWQQYDETERYFAFYQLLLRLLGSKDSFTYIIQKKA
ncbi:DUF1803 domain-containing protein [Candidatus Enterococcus ferrettii]|uniref:DUF1803 domain-containing protein n=1 Tax=Candidatus Enterococcus ferrettii TaxID=2815324 RepID=A0ABV0ENW4_9ENTE|nr:DUF1803 domain-containing protein [Enterococcus sp. 665A]MBO1342843.1 DUF1803 domain-containing protein [Enterococcus sp. 665A]